MASAPRMIESWEELPVKMWLLFAFSGNEVSLSRDRKYGG